MRARLHCTSVTSAYKRKTKHPPLLRRAVQIYGRMPPKEVNPFGNPKPFLRAAAAGGAKDAVQPPAASDDSAAAPQKSKKQMHRKDKVAFWVVH
jgi:hypothetical protein